MKKQACVFTHSFPPPGLPNVPAVPPLLLPPRRVSWSTCREWTEIFGTWFRMWVNETTKANKCKEKTKNWIRNMQLAIDRSARLHVRIVAPPSSCSAVRCASSAICCCNNTFTPPIVLCFCCYCFICVMNRLFFWTYRTFWVGFIWIGPFFATLNERWSNIIFVYCKPAAKHFFLLLNHEVCETFSASKKISQSVRLKVKLLLVVLVVLPVRK